MTAANRKEYKLPEVAFFQEGPGLRTHQWTAEGMKVINVTNILSDGSVDVNNTDKFISQSEFETRYSHFAVEENDVVVASSGNSYGKVGRARSEHLPLMMNTSVIRFHSGQPELLDDDFLYAFLRSPSFQAQVNAFVTGGAQPNFGPSHLKQMTISLPKLAEQRCIASIVSAYDEQMENNRRRMGLLEKVARLLYQEWFARLRFPGHEHTPITRGLPQGWEKKRLDAVADINRASLPGSFDGEIEYVDISAVLPGQITETSTHDFRDAPSRARRVVQHGDIIWSCVRPNRRSHAVIWNPPENLIVSTGFAVITPTAAPTSFVYYATTTDVFVGYLENYAKGAAYPAVVAGDFERASVVLPTKRLLTLFNEIVEPMFAQIHNLRLQNQKLRAARDLLLPQLMSGEISV